MTSEGPAPRAVLTGEKEVAAYAHPTRMRLLEVFGPRELTLTQAARDLGVHPANLSRHLKVLVEAGLLARTGTRDTGRNLEKYYRASALSYTVGAAPFRARARSVLGLLGESLADAEAASPDYVLGYLLSLRLKGAARDELAARLEALVEEFKALDEEGGEPLMLSLALYGGSFVAPADGEIRL